MSAEVATSPTVSTTPITTTSTTSTTVPRIPVRPNLKAHQGKTPYSVAMDNMVSKFTEKFVNDEMTEEQRQAAMESLTDTIQIIRDLCNEWLQPMCNGQQSGGAAVAAASSSSPVQAAATAKPLSDWQIFLKYASKLVPGHAESTDKMGLAKEHYGKMTDQECADLRARYEAENPNAVTAASAAAAAATTVASTGGAAKVKRQTGFTMFAKDWYAAFKAANPDASGLQSSLCSQAWKELPDTEKEEWKKLAKL